MHASTVLNLFLSAITAVHAIPFPMGNIAVSVSHYEVLHIRDTTTVNPNAIFNTTCGDPTNNIVFHDQNVAELSICGGIAGAIEKCEGSPSSTTGSFGTALFSLSTTVAGATISVSKGRWEGCVRAARAVCPTGGFSSVCVGGASSGNVAFTLAAQ